MNTSAANFYLLFAIVAMICGLLLWRVKPVVAYKALKAVDRGPLMWVGLALFFCGIACLSLFPSAPKWIGVTMLFLGTAPDMCLRLSSLPFGGPSKAAARNSQAD
jgi:hypothetical protein